MVKCTSVHVIHSLRCLVTRLSDNGREKGQRTYIMRYETILTAFAISLAFSPSPSRGQSGP